MKLPIDKINQKLKEIGLIDEKDKVVSLAQFKKMASVHQYGKGKQRLFIIFVGNPRNNMFAFYPPTETKPEMLKTAYSYLVDTATTELKQEYLDGNVLWGNCGYPLGYRSIRAEYSE